MTNPNCDSVRLRTLGAYQDTKIYELLSPQFTNHYYILSHPDSRSLMGYPEVVDFMARRSLLNQTADAFQFLQDRGLGSSLDILTILRGGLNYPLDEACWQRGIRVRDNHFLSCERKIENHVITGLEIKYDKTGVARDRVLAIGDILATGDTFRFCLDHFLDTFVRGGGSLRRFIFFTIGGTRAIPLMEQYAERFRELFPGFEGIDCFFYEGMFTVYEDKGASGINVPCIDFGWQGGVVSPDFRRFIAERGHLLYEKCIIYDGGARRYEIPLHFEEVLEYWTGIRDRADRIDPVALTAEKLGWSGPLSFEDWKAAVHYQELEAPGLEELWRAESRLQEEAAALDLRALAQRRIASIESIQSLYEE